MNTLSLHVLELSMLPGIQNEDSSFFFPYKLQLNVSLDVLMGDVLPPTIALVTLGGQVSAVTKVRTLTSAL